MRLTMSKRMAMDKDRHSAWSNSMSIWFRFETTRASSILSLGERCSLNGLERVKPFRKIYNSGFMEPSR
jgi:hypothetical protein